MTPLFVVLTYMTDGRTKTYQGDDAELTAKYIRYMEQDKSDTIEEMVVYTKFNGNKYSDEYTTNFTRGHRVDSIGSYVVDALAYYDTESETICSLYDMKYVWETRPDLRKDHPDFWQYLNACQSYNNGTLHII